ncbi:putative serine-threonine protein kinase [Aspergillus sclerotiicarbonarius CBS 121057]|uniref:Putative serine-threonine protein kinase n=1 Tax=Aspergillus sclerotiicarbonarius (strain CBS 121057 / IBT 28362) TaxID=1448318 RepID=A0A319E8L4_ASPSB|nr:putative serine-threonine protein kinase [Aspergillus sclerotiicarbonarius CBS 121057]
MTENNLASSRELEFKSFQDWNGDRPSLTLIFHDGFSSWWIKVEIAWSLPESILKSGCLKRRFMLQEFVKAIDFSQLNLMDDTVTRITLTLAERSHNPIPFRNIQNDCQRETNYFLSVAYKTSFDIAEDPGRTLYPILNQAQDIPTFEARQLEQEEDIAPTVSIIRFKEKHFAYKTIDRPIYDPGDTEHILNEITALAQFRGHPNIAQIIGLVISDSPYKTHPSTTSAPVITGFLLEYYPEGTLERVLSKDQDQDDSLLRRWALQTGRALETLHLQKRTHLDIKPSNIVLDANRNAILIDISGTGGYEWEWLSPEMQTFIQQNVETAPASTSFDKRVATDCWAYGNLLVIMAKKTGASCFGKRLQSIGDDLTKMDPRDRISLSDALERMSGQE